MLLITHKNDPVEYVNPSINLTGVSTANLNKPNPNPVIKAAKLPFAFNLFEKIPRKNTTNIGGAK